jgi:NAD(P)-dependent dehydrogenase (short-subunit alcohol dehydrogenase family)
MDLLGYSPPADLFRGRVVLVTGAGDGIGRAVSLGLAAHGASVVLLDRVVERLESAYDAIDGAGGPQPALYPMDLAGATPADYEDLATRVEQAFGRLDGLLHNAAELGVPGPIEQYEPEVWARIVQVGLHAPFLLTRACLPLLRRADDPSILFTSSAVGRRGKAYWGPYAVACGAVEVLAQVLADELEGAGVRVNTLDPGPVRTRLRARAYPAENPYRLPTPETVVPAYLYLLGPDSHGLSGKALSAQPSGRVDHAGPETGAREASRN